MFLLTYPRLVLAPSGVACLTVYVWLASQFNLFFAMFILLNIDNKPILNRLIVVITISLSCILTHLAVIIRYTHC